MPSSRRSLAGDPERHSVPIVRLDKTSAAATLTPTARKMHLIVLRAFTDTGSSPRRADLERLAGDQGVALDAMLKELIDVDVIAVDATGEIRAAYPFSPAETPIRVTWDGGPQVHAMCAIDALGMSTMLGRPVAITGTDPISLATVTIQVDHDQATWQPGSAVVFAGATAGDSCCPSVDRSCSNINFFASPASALEWASSHAAATGELLGIEEALAQGITEFGSLMSESLGVDRRPDVLTRPYRRDDQAGLQRRDATAVPAINYSTRTERSVETGLED